MMCSYRLDRLQQPRDIAIMIHFLMLLYVIS